jgi:trypsin
LSEKTNDTIVSKAASITINENYQKIYFTENDIALVVLATPVPWNHTSIKSVSVARETPGINTICRISGWNWDKALGGTLREVEVKLYSRDICHQQIMFDHDLPEGLICAAGERSDMFDDSCHGDTGGPLICNGQLVGIVTSGTSYCSGPRPALYTEVAFYGEWIARHEVLVRSNVGVKTVVTSSMLCALLFICQLFV